MSKYTHIFFDLDHTLWDFEKNSASAFVTVLEKHKMNVEHEVFLQTYAPINEAYWDDYRAEKVTKEELRYQRFSDTFQKLGHPISIEKIHQFAEDYIHHLPDTNHLFPGVVEVLNYLKRKYTLHIITDGFREVQDRKLANSKITHFFDTITTSDEVGAKKTNPKIFDYALQKAGAEKNKSVMIGDNLQADVFGALNYGIQAIHFSPQNNHDGLRITHYNQLFDLL